VKLSELRIIDQALSAFPVASPARQIVQREIRQLEAKADNQVAAFNAYCTHFGLRPDQLGKVFEIRRTKYRITGINPGAPRFPINVVRVHDGKVFRVPAADARSAA
jgi:hypothetical protein